MLLVDGIEYNVDVVKLKRKGDFLDRYAERSEDGDAKRELIGCFINYQLKLGPNTDPDDYDRLWEKLVESKEFHIVTVPYGSRGTYTFTAYFSNVSDELVCRHGKENIWNNLTVNFTSQKPRKGR